MDDHHNAAQLNDAFGTKTLYEILEISSSACEEEIRKNYRKLALRYHPDKGGDEKLFKALSLAHSILANPDMRKQYDATGEVDVEESGESYEHWNQYFRNLFPKVTIYDIEKFGDDYRGSADERIDVLAAYDKAAGNIKTMMAYIMCAEEGDEQRICSIIDEAILGGFCSEYSLYSKQKKRLLSQAGKASSNKKATRAVSKQNDDISDLAHLILRKRETRKGNSALGSILAKYGCKDSGAGEGEDSQDPMSDEAFEQARARLTSSSSSAAPKKSRAKK